MDEHKLIKMHKYFAVIHHCISKETMLRYFHISSLWKQLAADASQNSNWYKKLTNVLEPKKLLITCMGVTRKVLTLSWTNISDTQIKVPAIRLVPL
jgi:hypothetical protein